MEDTLNVLWHPLDSIPCRGAFPDPPAVLPLYYKYVYGYEAAGGGDTLAFRPSGAYSEWVPYFLSDNTLFVFLLFFCMMTTWWFLSRNPGMVSRWCQGFLGSKTEEEVVPLSDKPREGRCFLYLRIQLVVMLTLMFWVHAGSVETDPTRLLQLLPYFALLSALYMVMKHTLYRLFSWTFFDKMVSSRWKTTTAFLYALEGILMAVFLWLHHLGYPFAGWNIWLFTLLILKTALFYKAFCIFFVRLQGILHFIAYLCALEIMPFLCLWKGWAIMSETLL